MKIRKFKTAYVSISTSSGCTWIHIQAFLNDTRYFGRKVENLIIDETGDNLALSFDTGKWELAHHSKDYYSDEITCNVQTSSVKPEYIITDFQVKAQGEHWLNGIFGIVFKPTSLAVRKNIVKEGYVELNNPVILTETYLFSNFILHVDEKEKQ